MDSVAIVGVGLIGASFGLALKGTGFSGDVIGVSSEAALEAAFARGAITHSASLKEAAARADLIYLSQPVDRILETIELLGPLLRPGTLVTDAGSTKRAIVEKALAVLPVGSFLGGHPIAGKEQRGPQAADGNLFRDRVYVLTPVDKVDDSELTSSFHQLLLSIGVRIIEMSPAEHDTALALSSHLPQLLSTALAASLAEAESPHVRQVFGSGLLDMTRLALSHADLWSSILSSNQEPVLQALDQFQKTLNAVREGVEKSEVNHLFERASEFSGQIRKLSLGNRW